MPPRRPSLDQRPPAQPKNRPPNTLNRPIAASAWALERRIHAADREIGRQMGGDEQELHAADEVGRGHDQEGRISEGAPQRGLRRLRCAFGGARPASGRRSTRPAIQAAGSMPSASTRKPSTPARQPKSTASIWPSGADEQRAQRARGGDGAQHQAAQLAGHGARADGQRDGRGGAGQRQADHHARAQHHAEHALASGEQQHAGDVEDAAAQHHRRGSPRGRRARRPPAAGSPRPGSAPTWPARSPRR